MSYDFGGQVNVVELYISYLRKKLTWIAAGPHSARFACRLHPANPSDEASFLAGRLLASSPRALRLRSLSQVAPTLVARSGAGPIWTRTGTVFAVRAGERSDVADAPDESGHGRCRFRR